MERGNLLPSLPSPPGGGLVAVPLKRLRQPRDSAAPQGGSGRDSYREGKSSSTAAPEAQPGGDRPDEGTTRLVLVGSQWATSYALARWVALGARQG